MSANALQLLLATLVMVGLTFVTGLLMLTARVREMRSKRIHPQTVATAPKMASRLENTQAADSFRNQFETPVLFYALVAIALGTAHIPQWLPLCAWVYVGLRLLHALIHLSYNNVQHRLVAFLLGFALLQGMWLAYVIGLV